MPIEYAPLTPERLADVEAILLPVWNRRWDKAFTDRFFRWRFLERADWEAVVAYDGDRPIGFMDSFLRPYRTRNGVVRIREPADWFCHPDYRPVVSLKLIRGLMQKPEPILAVGGKAITVRTLPRLGYRQLPDLRSFVLPTGGGAVAKKLSKALGFPLSSVPGLLARPLSVNVRRRRRAGKGLPEVSVHPIRNGDEMPDVPSVNGAYGLSPILSRQEYDWFQGAPDRLGDFVWLRFEAEGGVQGISFSRVYREGPFRAVHLLHLDANRPSMPLYAAILSGTLDRLFDFRPQWISARFNCPLACEALRWAGFRETGTCTAYWWHRDAPPPKTPVHLSWTTSDEGLLPYPG